MARLNSQRTAVEIDFDAEVTAKTLTGWGQIAAYVARRTGVPLTASTALRWARRLDDPLPAQRWGPAKRSRIVADRAELDAWVARQWQSRVAGSGGTDAATG